MLSHNSHWVARRNLPPRVESSIVDAPAARATGPCARDSPISAPSPGRNSRPNAVTKSPRGAAGSSAQMAAQTSSCSSCCTIRISRSGAGSASSFPPSSHANRGTLGRKLAAALIAAAADGDGVQPGREARALRIVAIDVRQGIGQHVLRHLFRVGRVVQQCIGQPEGRAAALRVNGFSGTLIAAAPALDQSINIRHQSNGKKVRRQPWRQAGWAVCACCLEYYTRAHGDLITDGGLKTKSHSALSAGWPLFATPFTNHAPIFTKLTARVSSTPIRYKASIVLHPGH